MMLLLCLLITSPWLARAGNPKPLGLGTGNDQYKPVDPSYSTPDEVYKAGDKDDCHPVEEILYEKVQEEICKPQTSKYCEKFTNEFPYPVEKQNCPTEPMKKCELESRPRPKKAKKYIYNKECKPVTRQVCENREGKKLRPVCDKIQKSVCSYKPVEKCEEEKKEYCFKVEKKVWKKVCTPEKKLVVDDTFSYV